MADYFDVKIYEGFVLDKVFQFDFKDSLLGGVNEKNSFLERYDERGLSNKCMVVSSESAPVRKKIEINKGGSNVYFNSIVRIAKKGEVVCGTVKWGMFVAKDGRIDVKNEAVLKEIPRYNRSNSIATIKDIIKEKDGVLGDVLLSHNKIKYLQGQLVENKSHENGSCALPEQAEKPRSYVTSEAEAEKYAQAFCLSSVQCDVALLAVDVDSFLENFLLSEACGRITDDLRADGLIAHNTGLNLLESGMDAGCESQLGGITGGAVKFFTCISSAAFKLAKPSELESCLVNMPRKILQISEDWETFPEREQASCEKLKEDIFLEKDNLEKKKKKYQNMVHES